MGTGQMHPARSSHGILGSCERKIKRRMKKTCSVYWLGNGS